MDRPLCLCFGWVKIKGQWKYFPNSVLARFTMNDGENVFREFPLVTEEYMVDLNDASTGKTFPNIFTPENAVEKVSEGIRIYYLCTLLSYLVSVCVHSL